MMEQILDEMQILLSVGADPNWPTFEGNTLLHVAVQKSGSDDIVNALIDAGADVHIENDNGETALDLHFKTDWFITGSCSVLKSLIEAGCDVNYVDDENNTALHLAVDLLSDDFERFLINRGANINARDDNGRTPLHKLAGWSGNLQSPQEIQSWLSRIKFFLENGADINARDLDDATPLQIIVEKVTSTQKWEESTAETIIRINSDVMILDQNGHNILLIKDSIELSDYPKLLWQPFIRNIALKFVLKLLSKGILNPIIKNQKLFPYFKKCIQELKTSREKRLQGSRVSYFDLLIDNEENLFKHAKNKFLVAGFLKSRFSEEFPIYGGIITKRFNKVLQFIEECKSHRF